MFLPLRPASTTCVLRREARTEAQAGAAATRESPGEGSAGGKGMAGAAPGDRGQLAGLRSRPDLNGRRVEVRGQAAGRDGAPRLAVRLLFGAGAGTVLKVKAANLDLDKDRVLDPAMATLEDATLSVEEATLEMQALALGVPPPEEWRDWARGLPDEVLEKVAGKVVAQAEAGWAAQRKRSVSNGGGYWTEERIQKRMEERKREGNCLFVFALVCRGWRKTQLRVGGPLRTRVRSDVIMPGRVELVKWALAEGCPRDGGYDDTLAVAAADFGHTELVRWLIQEQGFAMDDTVMGIAAYSGNLELVRWLRGEGCDWNARACGSAAAAGRLAVLQWLRANGCPWDAETCNMAALNGHLETLRWACENGCDWNETTCLDAAQGGHLEVLEWLRAEGCPWDAETCNAAAQNGHLETLRWACENGCDWNETTCSYAAQGGHLEVLEWLRAEGCPWDAETCNAAAQNGHLETLRWARQNGCDWSAQTCYYAADSGHLEILEWLRAKGCPWDADTCHCAVELGHVEVLRWARENGCPWDILTRARAAEELEYWDDLGNLVEEEEWDGDDEYGYEPGYGVDGSDQQIAWLEEEVGWDSESDHE